MLTFTNLFRKYDYLVFFDLETTGLSPKECFITEIAALKFKEANGAAKIFQSFNSLVQLPDGIKLSEDIENLTGLTTDKINREGQKSQTVYNDFLQLFDEKGKGLVIAYNTQFDLSFIDYHLPEFHNANVDFLDSLTVFRELEPYPHKLSDAIERYELRECKNSHRALDDVYSLIGVTNILDQKCNLLEYVNVFGYLEKYGKPQNPLDKIAYFPQGI